MEVFALVGREKEKVSRFSVTPNSQNMNIGYISISCSMNMPHVICPSQTTTTRPLGDCTSPLSHNLSCHDRRKKTPLLQYVVILKRTRKFGRINNAAPQN
jgi:hypothetical protein